MKKIRVKEPNKKERKASLLTSMLLIFLSALVVSISLTMILFSLMGKSVYSKVLANAMRPQARMLSETTLGLFKGEITAESFRTMLQSSETEVILMNRRGEPFELSDPNRPEPREGEGAELMPPPEEPSGKPGGEKPMDSWPIAYLEYCREHFNDVSTAEPYNEYVDYPARIGVVVALPIKDSENVARGALFLIKPLNDIAETSKSIRIVLVISSVIVALLMVIPIYLISRKLTAPLKKLSAAADDLSAGDYSVRVVPEGSVEISELGSNFNVLADSLQKNIGELTVERNRLRAILDGLGEGIIGFDNQGRVTQYNNSAVWLLGADPEDDITRLPELERVARASKEVIEGDAGKVEVFSIGERTVRMSIAPIDEGNGQVVGAVALLLDVTENERLEQTRRDYVANVSHELRTPLASIRGIADMLCDGLVKNEEDKLRYYGYIQKESIRLSTLIDDLLELLRLQSGGVALKLRKMELYELIADVADRAEDHAVKRGMHVELTVPEGKYYAVSNNDRIEQVLITLMDNAIKHGEEGTAIRIGLDEKDEKWQIWVENPAEISEKDLDHIFERFYKADIAHTGEGTGLGLAIAEEVLRLMGETIGVKYENGSIRFTFTAAKYVN